MYTLYHHQTDAILLRYIPPIPLSFQNTKTAPQKFAQYPEKPVSVLHILLMEACGFQYLCPVLDASLKKKRFLYGVQDDILNIPFNKTAD